MSIYLITLLSCKEEKRDHYEYGEFKINDQKMILSSSIAEMGGENLDMFFYAGVAARIDSSGTEYLVRFYIEDYSGPGSYTLDELSNAFLHTSRIINDRLRGYDHTAIDSGGVRITRHDEDVISGEYAFKIKNLNDMWEGPEVYNIKEGYFEKVMD